MNGTDGVAYMCVPRRAAAVSTVHFPGTSVEERCPSVSEILADDGRRIGRAGRSELPVDGVWYPLGSMTCNVSSGILKENMVYNPTMH